MAKGTVGYTRPVGAPKVRASRGRNPGSGRRAAWLGAPRAEAFRPPDVTDPRRAITRLERRNKDTQHNNDMYQIGGGPITVKSHLQGGIPPERLAMAETRYPKGTIPFQKDAKGRILPGRIAMRQMDADYAKGGWRARGSGNLLPFGKPPEPTLGRGPNGRVRSNPAYREYKNVDKLNPQEQGTKYNNAVSRQFGDTPPSGITLSNVTESPSAPARTRYSYRTGKQQTTMVPKPNPSPINQTL